jgi:hypothetical protein
VPPNGLLAANALMQMAMMALVAALGADICYAIDSLWNRSGGN